jgi:hypothetical protein
MSKRWRQLQETLTQVSGLLDQLERRTEKMETILMVREPSSMAAADAYDGLRKQVVTAVTERLTHLAQLVQLDAALSHGVDADSLLRLVRDWVEQASLARITDPDHANRELLFVMVEDLGGPTEILEPAYMDTVTGRVIHQGRARRAAPPAGADAAGSPSAPHGAEQPAAGIGGEPQNGDAPDSLGPLVSADQAATTGEGTQ